MPYFTFLIAGAIGALLKDIIQDNKLVLPKKINGEFFLGFLGAMTIGAVAGFLIDGSFLTAFLAGYAGTSVIQNLVLKNLSKAEAKEKTVEDIIREISKEEGIDPELAVRVAKCESQLDPNAKNVNAPDSIDRGIFQINSKYHPSVTDFQAYDPVFSTRFFCKAFKAGKLSWWDATKKCWGKR